MPHVADGRGGEGALESLDADTPPGGGMNTPGSGVHGLEREREREHAPLALRATRPHTVGYIGGCDQEEGVIECPSRFISPSSLRSSRLMLIPPQGGGWTRRVSEFTTEEQLLRRNLKRLREGLVSKAHRPLYHSALGSRVIKKEKKKLESLDADTPPGGGDERAWFRCSEFSGTSPAAVKRIDTFKTVVSGLRTRLEDGFKVKQLKTFEVFLSRASSSF